MKFCKECDGRLVRVFAGDESYYQCAYDKKEYKASESDTLLYEETFERKSAKGQYNVILKNAAFDRVNPKIRNECKKCGMKIVRYVILGSEKKYVYACICGNIFQ